MKKKPNQLALFTGSLPAKSYCSNNKTDGLLIRNVEHAMRYRYVQYNHPNSKLWLVYDIDRPTCVSELTDDKHVPPPHFFVQNPDNQHAHAFYGLETAVHMNPKSSMKAIRFAAAVDCAFTKKIEADGTFVGLIAKNPAHAHWRTYTTNTESYDLGELSEYVDLEAYNDHRILLPETGLGRNVNLFNRTRRWAYRAIRQSWSGGGSLDKAQWDQAVLDRAIGYNAPGYEDTKERSPLPYGEVKATAKSIAKWTFQRFTPEGFSKIQSARGSRNGMERRELVKPLILEMLAQGSSLGDILGTFNISNSTFYEWFPEVRQHRKEMKALALEFRAAGGSVRDISLGMDIPERTLQRWFSK